MEFFNQDYRWSHQDYQNATHLEMGLKEIIDNDRYLIELNEPELFLLLLMVNTVLKFDNIFILEKK